VHGNVASDPHVLGEGFAPTPFTAEEIRRGCPDGRTVRMRLLGTEPAAGAAYCSVTRFTAGDADGATMEYFDETADRRIVGAVERVRNSWLDLQRHAAFPAADTTIDRETVVLPIGEYECLRYTVRSGAGETTFWFAERLPGMPVKSDTVAADGSHQTRVMIGNEYTA
jgi:hypothetical protein